ncbi:MULTISPECIES: DEAD/DEAH box helicase [unclassified Colwellia]|uniref:DEAD/DEAH box helicase n=1 Tax=unclassified Colwellia TaxID=196834 RepID=UPI0015F62D6D|nr:MULTISPECIES: DEAD/DEAH box helicase [unclassified Colwellia]MBA6234501.1 DEAD/DEAH box helicase [Colwellia sp. MB02u-7]MBA6236922.1 DEAD/DEAH box helicase [Colwellia sp. MB02u-11]MBA6299938.1 DEAD/DEAH box helicase [Colwellia sp. MB3u-22]MBA6312623.1 DEAD/DEAH box helicase [Colwellia sp. MB3u-64]
MSFTSLALDKSLTDAVNALGYTEATPIQQKAIPVILAGKDIMAGAQTGTGKTAAFALPILQKLMTELPEQRPVRALVLTPTRELALQVYKSFVSYAENTELNIAVVYGGVSINPQITALNKGADVLVATPGRLLDHIINGSLALTELEFLVFDEADRMLDMGFKDEIDRILNRVPLKRQTLLFSATFDDAIFKLSKNLLTDPELIEVSERNAAATKVEQVLYTVDSDRKRELTSFLIGSKNWKQVLIFTRTKQTADDLAKEMCKDGIKTQSIHGDKSQGAREKALAEFKEGKTRALVATDVASRGLDIADLNYVINYELPYIAEDYIHRIGRTGRAGNEGLAVSLMSPSEEWLLEAVEKVLDTRLLQQWYPGYEPDLTKTEKPARKGGQKQRDRKKALGQSARSKKRTSTESKYGRR